MMIVAGSVKMLARQVTTQTTGPTELKKVLFATKLSGAVFVRKSCHVACLQRALNKESEYIKV